MYIHTYIYINRLYIIVIYYCNKIYYIYIQIYMSDCMCPKREIPKRGGVAGCLD
jgi:hypothetical protein